MPLTDPRHLDPRARRVDRGPSRPDLPQGLGALDVAEGDEEPPGHPPQRVGLAGIRVDGLGRLDQLEGVVDGAGSQKLEGHAPRVEDRRVAPAPLRSRCSSASRRTRLATSCRL